MCVGQPFLYPNKKINMPNQIGLDKTKAQELAQKLNELLANYQIFYMNTRGYHWNIKGQHFFMLHEKFEELYNDSFLKIDEIAERILTLGSTPDHSYKTYFERATLSEHINITDGKEAVQGILDAYQLLLPIEREILDMASEAGDEGTAALMSDYIREQEKLVWMYTAFVK